MERAPRFLVGCARSGVMAQALRRHGAIAAECDTEEARAPGWHIRGDVRDVMRWGRWDAAIFHPTCRYLTNAGVRWLYQGGRRINPDGTENPIDPVRWAEMEQGAAFFRECLDAPIPFVAVENPIMHEHAAKLIGEDFAFSFQPHQHGEPEFKRSCIWIRGGLPIVEPSNELDVPKLGTDEHKAWSKVHRATPGPDREELRSETLAGVADALAAAWVPFVAEAINRRAAA
jgi:hypothetical protein